jgi:hypothetical protein
VDEAAVVADEAAASLPHGGGHGGIIRWGHQSGLVEGQPACAAIAFA